MHIFPSVELLLRQGFSKYCVQNRPKWTQFQMFQKTSGDRINWKQQSVVSFAVQKNCLRRFLVHIVSFILLTNKKNLFTVARPTNKRNDRIYTPATTRRKGHIWWTDAANEADVLQISNGVSGSFIIERNKIYFVESESKSVVITTATKLWKTAFFLTGRKWNCSFSTIMEHLFILLGRQFRFSRWQHPN